MSQTDQFIEVNRPVSTVYNQYTQFEEFPRFMEGVERVHQIRDDLLHWVVEIGGKRREFDAKITEQIPEKRIAWTSTDGKTTSGVVTFHYVDPQKTRVAVQMSYDPEGIAENVADWLGIVSARVKGDLQRFKEFVENRPQETGAWRGEIREPGR
ncbi:MAG: hypothetical protein QOD06_1198 [Candidatus Binatota bacterium]|nr:hypothetical protein [Candidatus Binatota bacterium]